MFIRRDGEVWMGEQGVLYNLRHLEGGNRGWKQRGDFWNGEDVQNDEEDNLKRKGRCMEVGEEGDVYKEGKRQLESGGRQMEMF